MTEQALVVSDETSVITDDAIKAAAKYDPRAQELEAAKRLWTEIEIEVRRGNLEPGAELTNDDIRAIQDSFDGATTLDTLIRKLLLDNLQLKTVAPGIDAVIADLQARKKRAADRYAWNEALVEQAMIAANWTTKEKAFECDIARVTVRRATAQVDYVDELKIPAIYYKRPDPVLDKATLKTKVMARYKALQAALALKDDNERGAALAKVQEDFGDEIPGTAVKVDGYTTTIKYA